MAKNKHARSEQAPTKTSDDASLRPIRVEGDAYDLAIERLQHLQTLLACVSAHSLAAFNALDADQQADVFSLALSLAHGAEQALETGSY